MPREYNVVLETFHESLSRRVLNRSFYLDSMPLTAAGKPCWLWPETLLFYHNIVIYLAAMWLTSNMTCKITVVATSSSVNNASISVSNFVTGNLQIMKNS